MDGSDRRQSQYGPPYQPPSNHRPAPGQSMGPPHQDAYSLSGAPTQRGNLAGQAPQRSYIQDYNYGYQQPQFPSQMQYPSSYVQDASRQSQMQQQPSTQQQYGAYVPGSMLPPVGQSQMYENLPQYQQQRHTTALEVMTNQFSTGGLQYIPQGESSGTASMQSGSQAFMSTQPEQAYSHLSYARPQLQPPFAPRQSDYMTIDQSALQQTQEDPSTRQAVEEQRRQYEQQVISTFDDIIAGRINEASSKVLGATDWLVRNVRTLNLQHDEEGSQTQRITLWRDLNHAWEALAQKQKSATENALRTQQQPSDLLSADAIQDLVNKLIGLCDQLEKYGLVDYEMGIWEEQIIDALTQCLDLLPQSQSQGSNNDKG